MINKNQTVSAEPVEARIAADRRTSTGSVLTEIGLRRTILALSFTATLASCATPETRVKRGLMSAGLSEPISACMAERMVDRLSLGQLNKLRGLGKLRKEKPGDVNFNEFVKRTKALRDPEIVSVVTSSGVICTVK